MKLVQAARSTGRALVVAANAVKGQAREIAGLAGVAGVVTGVYQISAPAAWIVGGLLLLAAAIFVPRSA